MNKGECEEIKLRLGKTDISLIHEDGRKRRWLLLIPTVAAVEIFIAFASVDKVNDREDEVIATFGLVMGTAETGRRFKLSLGIQDVYITDARLAEEKTAGGASGEMGICLCRRMTRRRSRGSVLFYVRSMCSRRRSQRGSRLDQYRIF